MLAAQCVRMQCPSVYHEVHGRSQASLHCHIPKFAQWHMLVLHPSSILVCFLQGVLTFPAPSQAEDEDEKPAPTYAGSLDNGVRQGSGKYTWSDGAAFAGSYDKGLKQGFGTLTFADGSKYEGVAPLQTQHGDKTYIGGLLC